MLTIRLVRAGKKNTAQFKVMLQERTVAPGGRHIEVLGSYDPHSKKAILKTDRIKYWIEKGAFLSDTAHNLLVKKGVIAEKKRTVKMPEKAIATEAPVSEPASAEASVSVKTSVDESAGKQETVSSEQKKEEVVTEKKEEVAANQETVSSKQEKTETTNEVVAEKIPEVKAE